MFPMMYGHPRLFFVFCCCGGSCFGGCFLDKLGNHKKILDFLSICTHQFAIGSDNSCMHCQYDFLILKIFHKVSPHIVTGFTNRFTITRKRNSIFHLKNRGGLEQNRRCMGGSLLEIMIYGQRNRYKVHPSS